LYYTVFSRAVIIIIINQNRSITILIVHRPSSIVHRPSSTNDRRTLHAVPIRQDTEGDSDQWRSQLHQARTSSLAVELLVNCKNGKSEPSTSFLKLSANKAVYL
jgi:hypothetical protein